MAIVPSGVSVPAQSKELDNNVVTTSYGTVYRQVVNLADPETPTNYQRVGSNGAYVDVRNVVSLPLPTGASTAALQTSGNASLTSIDTKLPSLDGGYVPVTIKNSSIEISNDAGNPVPVSGTFWQATQPVSGTFWQATQPVSAVSLPLPTGAATESTLSALSAKFSALGQKTMSASVPVVLASNHSDIVTKKSASSYAHLNSTGTTTIKSGAGILRRVVVNTNGSVSNTFTIYDNTSGSGTVIAAIDTVNGVSGHFEYNVAFSTGLTVVDATGASADITVIYE
jgi:hypothetical protein